METREYIILQFRLNPRRLSESMRCSRTQNVNPIIEEERMNMRKTPIHSSTLIYIWQRERERDQYMFWSNETVGKFTSAKWKSIPNCNPCKIIDRRHHVRKAAANYIHIWS